MTRVKAKKIFRWVAALAFVAEALLHLFSAQMLRLGVPQPALVAIGIALGLAALACMGGALLCAGGRANFWAGAACLLIALGLLVFVLFFA